MSASEEQIDKMLFNYLEGNFSDEKALQVEREIASDPLIREELNLWKSSYIHDDFYGTSVIENSLLQKHHPFNPITLFLNSILVIGIAFISGTSTKTDLFSMPSSPIIQPIEIIAIVPKSTMAKINSKPEVKIHVLKSNSKIEPENDGLLSHLITQDNKQEHIPSIEKLPIDLNKYAINPHQFIIEPKLDPPTKAIKKIDRKTLRAYRKLKRKAERNRMASKFIKGDIPYVVPVNTNNF